MSALVGAGVGVALVPSLARTGNPQVRDLQITPQPTRYIGAWLPTRHQPNPAAERLISALRTRALAKPQTQPGPAWQPPPLKTVNLFNGGGYGNVRSSPVLARKPSMRPGQYCIRLSRVFV
jgi:hypothetical protein